MSSTISTATGSAPHPSLDGRGWASEVGGYENTGNGRGMVAPQHSLQDFTTKATHRYVVAILIPTPYDADNLPINDYWDVATRVQTSFMGISGYSTAWERDLAALDEHGIPGMTLARWVEVTFVLEDLKLVERIVYDACIALFALGEPQVVLRRDGETVILAPPKRKEENGQS